MFSIHFQNDESKVLRTININKKPGTKLYLKPKNLLAVTPQSPAMQVKKLLL